MAQLMKLDGIFSDGMIFQREVTNELWGTDAAAQSVTAQIDGVSFSASVENGRFRLTMPAHDAAEGLTLTVSGSEEIVLNDICFGDVLLLTGQSNMELPVGRVLDASPDTVNDSYPLIRQFSIRPLPEVGRPAESIPENKWIRAQGGELLMFSAAGYFCARRIFLERGVPVGLILAAQGGSVIESWMPEEALARFGDYSEELKRFSGEGVLGGIIARRDREIAGWTAVQDTGVSKEYSAAVPEGAGRINVPFMLRDTELKGFCGSVWFYKDVFLDEQPQGECMLRAGVLIDSDTAYVNGTQIGQTGYRYPPRKYRFDAGLLHKGHNLVAIRLIVSGRDGGFIAAHPYRLETGSGCIDLTGEWLYKIEHTADDVMPVVQMAQSVPTWLYNGSIVPLAGLRFAGSLWYQGESNAEDWERYDEKFALMLECWRSVLKQPLPVICVEMCDYVEPTDADGSRAALTGDVHNTPGWDRIQEFQKHAPETAELCECVSAKDLGELLELHPQRKEELGERLAKKVLEFF